MEPTTFVSGGTRRRRLRKRSYVRLLVLVVIALVLIAGGARATSWLFAPEMVRVPDLVGMSLTRASNEAEGDGLHIKVVDRRRDISVPRGHVIDQTPTGGELEEGSTVRLVLSTGPPLIEVPNVMGLDLDQAKIRLRARELAVGDVSYEYSGKPNGTVIAQVPFNDKREWGTRVDLVVSKGPEPISVPEVVGKRAAKAEALFAQAGFEVVFVDTYSDEVEDGRVISTEPSGGAIADKGTTIRVFVSIGPRFKEVTMPDVRDMHVDEARAKLEGLGLRVKVVQSCDGGTTVVDTHPIAGTIVHENDRVALFVC